MFWRVEVRRVRVSAGRLSRQAPVPPEADRRLLSYAIIYLISRHQYIFNTLFIHHIHRSSFSRSIRTIRSLELENSKVYVSIFCIIKENSWEPLTVQTNCESPLSVDCSAHVRIRTSTRRVNLFTREARNPHLQNAAPTRRVASRVTYS